MVRYRRNFVPGGTYFFTVTLADRRSRVLVEHIGALRAAFRTTRRERPFAIDAIVVLPEHLHAVMTLPRADADFSGRWRRIKSLFTRGRSGGDVSRRSCRRIPPVAATVLGAHHPRRPRLRPPCRLHSYQSAQAWSGYARDRLAVFLLSPLCAAGTAAA